MALAKSLLDFANISFAPATSPAAIVRSEKPCLRLETEPARVLVCSMAAPAKTVLPIF